MRFTSQVLYIEVTDDIGRTVNDFNHLLQVFSHCYSSADRVVQLAVHFIWLIKAIGSSFNFSSTLLELEY